MKTALKYLEEMHGKMGNSYSGDFGNVAREVATRLILDGEEPEIFYFVGKTERDDPVKRELITLKPYNAKTVIAAHFVCGANGMIYDPMFKNPVRSEDYPRMAFNEETDMEILFDRDKTRKIFGNQ